jgi:salicylate hydroxylase
MIVIIGAGIGGLAAALAAADHGEVVVLERRGAVEANAGAGIQLSPNAMKALAVLGAEAAVRAVATRPPGLVIRSAGRRAAVTRVDYAALPARFGAPTLTVARAALHAALLGAVRARGIDVRFEARVTRLDGAALPEHGLSARLVVVADGVGSALAGGAPRETGAVAWRGRGRPAGADTVLTMAAGAHLVRYSIGEGDNVVFVTGRGRDPAAFAGSAIGPEIADVEGWVPWPIRVRPAHVFARGPAAVLGDAAHAMPPFLAQGGAMALEDAAVLKLALAAHGPTEQALARYAAVRAPRTRRVATETARQGILYHLPAPASLARDAVMARLGPGAVLARVAWLYGWTPDLPDGRSGGDKGA